VRCAWCEREATVYVEARYLPPCCGDEACIAESADVGNALWEARDKGASRLADYERRAGGDAITTAMRNCTGAEDAVEARDARELRGEPPDMSGWTIFDGSAP
jgi:hypothetical protein